MRLYFLVANTFIFLSAPAFAEQVYCSYTNVRVHVSETLLSYNFVDGRKGTLPIKDPPSYSNRAHFIIKTEDPGISLEFDNYYGNIFTFDGIMNPVNCKLTNIK